MDFVTHAAVGALVGRALSPDDLQRARRCVWWGALVNLLPDVDHVLEWVSAEAYLMSHRTLTHSLLFAGLVVLTSAVAPGDRRRRTAVVAASLAAHFLLDVLTPFGTGLLWPFSDHLVKLDGLPIPAPWILIPTLVMAALVGRKARAGPTSGRRAARVALGVLAALLALELGVSLRAAHAVPDGPATLSMPDWRQPLGARAFVVTDDAVLHYAVGIEGDAELVERIPTDPTPDIPDAAQAPLSRFRVPVARVEGSTVTWTDAQFRTVDPDRPPFVLTVHTGTDPPTHQVEQVMLGTQPIFWLVVVLVTGFWTRPARSEPRAAPS